MKMVSPAAQRNAEGILEILRGVFPSEGLVLEIASGNGYHAAAFSSSLPTLRWQPTDLSPEALPSIRAWAEELSSEQELEPLLLDVCAATWPVAAADAMLCVNMIHISPWEATVGLMEGAARTLSSGAPLVTYGPYRIEGEPFAPSNEAFHRSLRQRNPSWGIRDLDEVVDAAKRAGLELESRHPMPANNQTLVFRRK